MADFFFFGLIMLVLVLVLLGGGSPSKEQKSQMMVLWEVQRFVVYCEEHKDELPENVRERLDELESACEKIKKATEE